MRSGNRGLRRMGRGPGVSGYVKIGPIRIFPSVAILKDSDDVDRGEPK